MGVFFDLHRHDEFSSFDGFGKPIELAKIAKDLGYPALGTSNHGNITSAVKHWLACKEVGIKPIIGSEVYFQPKFNKTNPERKSYHLCLFAKNLQGWKNLCHILTEANKEQFYYKPVVDFKLLEKYKDGIICTSACIAGVVSQSIIGGNIDMANKLLNKFKSIYGKDFYVEIQPYKIDKKGTQQKTDYQLMRLARTMKIKCILTSDSHYGEKEDFDTYCKMHKIGKTTLDVESTYSERYMPSKYEIAERFANIYKNKFKDSLSVAEMFIDNLKKLEQSVEGDFLSELKLELPIADVSESKTELIKLVKQGLKSKGKYNKEYIERCKFEIDVIDYQGFVDYFLIVQEYVNWAKQNNIEVGDGRGSACNCLVAYAIGITDVDSIKYKLDFSRFMRKEKKKLPDIDVDFETDKRQLVIDHVINKYPGKAVQICLYGEYSIDNLVNDLSGVCGLVTTGKDIDFYEKQENKDKISEIKRYIREFMLDELNMDALLNDVRTETYNSQYDNIIKHFSKLYGKMRYLGKHAAGVAVVGTDISDYTCVIRRDKGLYTSCFDLNDLEHINCTKFDMLGLRTLSEIKELREFTKYEITENDIQDENVYKSFREQKTDGIFQMEKATPKKILSMIQCDCPKDVFAVNALNRPAPLQLKMNETYAYNKLSGKIDTASPYYKYTMETYGTILYQEQTIEVAQSIGHLSAEQSFDLLKIMKKQENLTNPEYVPVIKQMQKDFFNGCKSEGLELEEIKQIWASLLIYGFNKGHSVGYSLIGIKQMIYKIYFPTEFWYVKMKYAGNDIDIAKYSICAIKEGVVVMLPHINYTAKTSIRKMDGEYVIQKGLSTIKDVGDKASEIIEQERNKNGIFKDYDDFYDRCIGGAVNKKVLEKLKESGAMQFNRDIYLRSVIKYNSAMLGR